MLENLIPNVERLMDAAKAFAYYLPLIWASMILVEWITQFLYYHEYHIDHSFGVDYRIVFNPNYVLTLIVTLVLMFVTYLLAKVSDSFFYFMVFVGLFYESIQCLKIRDERETELDELYEDEKHNVVNEYRSTNEAFNSLSGRARVFFISSIIWLLGGVIIRPEIKELLAGNDKIVQLLRVLSDALQSVGGFYPIAFIFWLIVSSALMHWALRPYIDSQMISYDDFRYFRVIVYKQMTYVILAPTYTNRNEICIAVRTIICRKKNGIIVGTLILDDVITQKAPYEGESFLIGVDKVKCMLPQNYQSALSSDNAIKDWLVGEKMNEYLMADRKWQPLIYF